MACEIKYRAAPEGDGVDTGEIICSAAFENCQPQPASDGNGADILQRATEHRVALQKRQRSHILNLAPEKCSPDDQIAAAAVNGSKAGKIAQAGVAPPVSDRCAIGDRNRLHNGGENAARRIAEGDCPGLDIEDGEGRRARESCPVDDNRPIVALSAQVQRRSVVDPLEIDREGPARGDRNRSAVHLEHALKGIDGWSRISQMSALQSDAISGDLAAAGNFPFIRDIRIALRERTTCVDSTRSCRQSSEHQELSI